MFLKRHRVFSFGNACSFSVLEMRLFERYSLCSRGHDRPCSEATALKFRLSSTRLTRCWKPSRFRSELLERESTCAW